MISMPVAVNLGELKSSRTHGKILVCYGLGSCIGMALIDPQCGAVALAHVVLPDSDLSRGADFPPGRYADTAVPAALAELALLGAQRGRIIAKLVGGARILKGTVPGSQMDIGSKNTEATRAALAKHGIPVRAEDTGGNYGRTMQLFPGTGKIIVSSVGRGSKEL